MCVTVCAPVDDVLNFEINLAFYQAVLLHDQKNQDKNLNILVTKRALR